MYFKTLEILFLIAKYISSEGLHNLQKMQEALYKMSPYHQKNLKNFSDCLPQIHIIWLFPSLLRKAAINTNAVFFKEAYLLYFFLEVKIGASA